MYLPDRIPAQQGATRVYRRSRCSCSEPVRMTTTAPSRHGPVATHIIGGSSPDRNGPPEALLLGAGRWSIHSDRRRSVIRLEGQLDPASLQLVDRWVDPLAGMGQDLAVDIDELRSCGFAELSLLLRWRTSANAAGGSMRLTSTPGQFSGLLGLVGFADTSASTSDTSSRRATDRFRPMASVAGPTSWEAPEL